MKPKVVVLGFMSHFPVAGVAWQTIHYLIGFQRLGCEVFYVEAHGCTPSKLMRDEHDDGPARAADYISGILTRFGLGRNWAYHAIYDSRWFGMDESQLSRLYREAALIINLHGSHLPTAELTATNRLVFLETDPVDLQIEIFNGKKEALEYLAPHCAFFTFGENLGAADCLVPAPAQFKFIPTRQPVVMDFWNPVEGGEAAFTTIGNWRQPWREIQFMGETLRWSKHFEFHKFISLPEKFPQQPFELALSSYNEEDQRLLESRGWRVRPGLELSRDPDVYRDYISRSHGEFTVAKEQNIRLRSGWFSDRAATYLAAGRPVITQETGFSKIFPTGHGLFAFSSMEELCAAVEAINSAYDKHRLAARRLAQEFFSHDVVLGRILGELGVVGSKPSSVGSLDIQPGAPASGPTRTCLQRPSDEPGRRQALPPDMALTPVSRWPTRLPEPTFQAALALPVPVAVGAGEAIPGGVSIIIVTHNGLAYTKLCLTALLACWRSGDELIIVDNASTDGTPKFLGELAKQNRFVKVILNQQNRGFAPANNQALAIAKGAFLVLLNNDTLVCARWLDILLAHLSSDSTGLAGPVTNRTCNEAQISAPCGTFGEFENTAAQRAAAHAGEQLEIPMLAMFCVAMQRDVFDKVGLLDEQFEVGMFEDDDYARRVRAAGLKVVCAEDVFVYHFGQGSFGELCTSGDYDKVLEANRQRFERKWGVEWQPHARRITPEYEQLRQRVCEIVAKVVPAGAKVAVISKGDEELVKFPDRRGLHFPQNATGTYSSLYPVDGPRAVADLENLRRSGADFLVIPQPAFWWLDYYADLRLHLEANYLLSHRDDAACLVFDLRGGARA